MVNVWRVVPAVGSALVVVVWSVFSFAMVEVGEQREAGHLGYAGATVRAVVIPSDGPRSPDHLNAAVQGFIADHDASVAYSKSSGTGLVTMLDEHGRFRNSEGDLASLLSPVASGRTIAIADAVGGSARDLTRLLGSGGGVEDPRTFHSDVMFEGAYPIALSSVGERPFGEGVYLFAGGDLAVSDVANFFDANGMDVVHVVARDRASAWVIVGESLAVPYGMVYLMFIGIVALALLFVMRIHASLCRDSLVVAAVLGAAQRRLWAITMRRLLLLGVAGLAGGGVLSLVVVVAGQGLALGAQTDHVAAVCLALAFSSVTLALVCSWVAWREARGVARVIPC